MFENKPEVDAAAVNRLENVALPMLEPVCLALAEKAMPLACKHAVDGIVKIVGSCTIT